MAEARRTIDVAGTTIVKIILAVVVVWLWLHLWQLLMLVLVAVMLAIGLEPLVEWLERRRVPRGLGAAGVVLLLTALVVGFFYVAGSSLTGQAHELSSRATSVEASLLRKAPPFVRRSLHNQATPDASTVAGYVLSTGRLVVDGAIVGVLALILTLYLLIEGCQTYDWLVAYVPKEHRPRVHTTARGARRAIRGYIVGNVATSAFAAIFVFVSLTLLKVPAALLLAVLAGLFDFVPVLGFICSSVPAILLALTVSPLVAAITAGLYVAYHLIENYYIGPKVYGDRLRLSNLSVILAFAVGAEIGGIVGALLALPVAALYPVIESVWLKDYLARDAADSHRRIEAHARDGSA